MLRIHLAQILYNPAYYDAGVDYLEEPSFLREIDAPLGRMRSNHRAMALLVEYRAAYIEHIREKLARISEWSGRRGANVLVLPEYSVPVQALPDLQSIAAAHSLTIVAGSHRVPLSGEASGVYQHLAIPSASAQEGSAVVPILHSDGSVSVTTKFTRSKWEPNLAVPATPPESVFPLRSEPGTRLGVVPCIDCLQAKLLAGLLDPTTTDIIVCPSLSPTSTAFKTAGNLALLNDIPLGYVNAAMFGGTFFNIPPSWRPYLRGLGYVVDELPPDTEAVFELDLDPRSYFAKKGSLNTAPNCGRPFAIPVAYGSDSTWLSQFSQLPADLSELLKTHGVPEAIEWLDGYLAQEGSALPPLLRQNVEYLRHSILPLYDGNAEALPTMLEVILIGRSGDDTRLFWGRRVRQALKLATQELAEASHHSTAPIIACITSLKEQERHLPQLPSEQEPALATTPPEITGSTYIGEEDLVEAFQNRGSDLDLVKTLVNNPENKVVVITGILGVGKSDLLNCTFRKVFGDWDVVRVHVAGGARVARLIAEVGYKLGVALDVDAMGRVTHGTFHQIARKLVTQLYSKPRRALIIDDIHHILKDGNRRDHTLLETFLREAGAPEAFIGGRLFIVSSMRPPDPWLHQRGVCHIHLRGLRDPYIRRILEYHLRRSGLVEGEALPEVPQALLDIVSGHPLSARLLINALRSTEINTLQSEMTIERVASSLAERLLNHASLTEEQQLLMRRLAVFRLPVRLDVLKRVPEFVGTEDALLRLANGVVMGFDGHSLELHEAVRRFFYAQVVGAAARTENHKVAAKYYEKIYEEHKRAGGADPGISAEFVHHLALCGEAQKAKDLRLLIVEELKPAARKLYREDRDYPRALSLFRLIAEVVPSDPEVLAYVGRCYARMGQWPDSDTSFEGAIQAANRLGQPTWWIHRDWGQIRARYSFYAEARQHLDRAHESNHSDPSIKAALAYMHWHQGDRSRARELFEQAVRLGPYHEYTLTYYPRLLEELGDAEYADMLRARLDEIEVEARYRQPREYDIEIDHDEL
jgi:tetratricopeptide (TPR) repeat protein/predicted amidohydrolase